MMNCYLKVKFLKKNILKDKKTGKKIIKLIIESLSPNNSNIKYPNPMSNI